MVFSNIALLGAIMIPTATAHMIMAKPVPYGSPNNSPLDPSGSDYPCKLNGGSGTLEIKTMNQFKVGENQTLSFTGSASHNGGSCQLAVTLDKTPTKSSKFKVIHSIEGACPGPVQGQISDFSFPVPSDLPNGEAMFAWGWWNKVGNREFYMNCAPITVSGGASDLKAFDALPDMALANIKVGSGASCKTAEGSDYIFEQPGKSVVKLGPGPFVKLCGGAAPSGDTIPAHSVASGGAGPSQVPNNGLYTPVGAQTPMRSSMVPIASSIAPVTSSMTPAASSPAVIVIPISAISSSDGAMTSIVRTLITITTPKASTAPTNNTLSSTLMAAPANSTQSFAPIATANSTAPVPSAQPPTTPAPGAGSTACSTGGALLCNGETQFGLCNHGKVVFQAVAPGTKCSNGQIMRRGFARRHLGRAV